MPAAVIVRAHLPAGLEMLRRRSVSNAVDGVPAHLTLLYPFVEPAALGPRVRVALAEVASRHRAIAFELRSAATWPDVLYVEVAPVGPFAALQHDLAAAFPEYPLYGSDVSLTYVPHVTIADGRAAHDPAVERDPSWAALPRQDLARAIEVIATRSSHRWHVVWRIPLSGADPVG